jgi:hypothetical protein
MVRLPITGIEVRLYALTGWEDILLQEATALDTDLAFTLAQRITSLPNGEPVAWESLPVGDLEAFLLLLRRAAMGDAICAEARCSNIECGSRIDIAFGIGDYLRHHAPQMPRGVEPSDDPGWFELKPYGLFRPPTVGDQMAARRQARPRQALIAQCIRRSDLPAKAVRRIEGAMEQMAPALSGELEGVCPECGIGVTVLFDPQQYILTELRYQAAFIYEDVCLLARAYHWSEAEILALPAGRRLRYTEIARERGGE